jgi:hypothetical protein
VGLEDAEQHQRYDVANENGEQEIHQAAAEMLSWLLGNFHLAFTRR